MTNRGGLQVSPPPRGLADGPSGWREGVARRWGEPQGRGAITRRDSRDRRKADDVTFGERRKLLAVD